MVSAEMIKQKAVPITYLVCFLVGLASYFTMPWYARIAPAYIEDVVILLEGYRWLYRLSLATLLVICLLVTPRLRIVALVAVCFWISAQSARFDSRWCETATSVFDYRAEEYGICPVSNWIAA